MHNRKSIDKDYVDKEFGFIVPTTAAPTTVPETTVAVRQRQVVRPEAVPNVEDAPETQRGNRNDEVSEVRVGHRNSHTPVI